jgi:hypothetical protein
VGYPIFEFCIKPNCPLGCTLDAPIIETSERRKYTLIIESGQRIFLDREVWHDPLIFENAQPHY